MGIEKWSTTAANNATADPPINWAEGMLPSQVNDSARSMMAAIREWGEDSAWFNFGDTVAYASAASFTVAGDLRARYHVNRRVRAQGSSTGTIAGTITASTYSNPNTTVTVNWDLGASLSNEALTISLGSPAASGGWPAAALGHASTVKAWVRFIPSSGTIIDSYNVSSIGTTGAGIWTVNFHRPFLDSNYLVVGSAGNTLGAIALWDITLSNSAGNLSASSCTFEVGVLPPGGGSWAPNSTGNYVGALFLGRW